jgi:hypothetical protein
MDLVLNNSPLVDFGRMVKDLRGYKMAPFQERASDLKVKQKQLQVIMETKRSTIGKDERLKTLQCVFSDEEYCAKVIEILEEMMPLWEMGIEESWSEEGDFLIMIEPQGLNCFNGDEAYECVSDIRNCSPDFSLTAFLLLLNFGFDEEEIWQECIEYFGWPFTEAVGFNFGQTFDMAFLKRYLKKNGLQPLYAAAELAFKPKSNAFLDANNEDPDSVYYPFSAENIEYLLGQWKIAGAIMEKYEAACELVKGSPEILAPFFEGLRLSYGRGG